jgi:hypothetical protein
MLLPLPRGSRPVFSVVLRQASISRGLRTPTNPSAVLAVQCVSRPPFLTIDIHSESVADTPSITMGNMIEMTL